jgi:hypothetical protein
LEQDYCQILVSLSSALTFYYFKDSSIAFFFKKKILFVPAVTVMEEIGKKSLRKKGPSFVNRSY